MSKLSQPTLPEEHTLICRTIVILPVIPPDEYASMSWNVEDRLLSRYMGWICFSGLVVITGLTTSTLSGCSEKFTPPKVYPVKGQVFLADGKPLTTGVVFLVSKVATDYPGKIESDGHFSISTPAGEGAPEGEYTVRIEPEMRAPSSSRSGKKSYTNLPFPAKYTDDTTSDLKVTVKPGENTLEPFKLVPGSATAKSTNGKKPDKRD